MTERGKFIVFEGNDGAGKTTLIPAVAGYLREHGFDVLETKEPGGMEETKPIRTLIFDEMMQEDGIGQLLLFVADRRVHLVFQVIPALRAGIVVVSDRFSDSTVVYQSERGVALKTIFDLDKMSRSGIEGPLSEIKPDLVILLDVDPRVGMMRKETGDKKDKNYFDGDKIGRQAIRRAMYLRLAHQNGSEIIDTTDLTQEQVFERVVAILRNERILPKEKR